MIQSERRIYLIKELLSEQPRYKDMAVPPDEQEQKNLLRALMNVRIPAPIADEFLEVQDEYMQEEAIQRGIVDINDLTPIENGIYLWKGDITRLKCGAIVNAANSGMTGCYQPLHNCIDNCIHSAAGIQLRNYCAEMMKKQGYEEPTGQAKITPAYNLPCDYVIHTVGPIVSGMLTAQKKAQLISSYHSCLRIAADNSIESVAFCCISTGVFGFPQREAAQIAVKTVRGFLKNNTNVKRVIFNVFKDSDEQLYRGLLGQN